MILINYRLITSLLLGVLVILSFRAYSLEGSIELEGWYLENREEIFRVKRLMGENPKIKRVEPALDIQFIPGSNLFSEGDLKVYRKLESICREIGSQRFVAYWIDGEQETFRVDVESQGLLVSGVLFSIVYETNKEYINDFSPSERVYAPLDIENWYQLKIVN